MSVLLRWLQPWQGAGELTLLSAPRRRGLWSPQKGSERLVAVALSPGAGFLCLKASAGLCTTGLWDRSRAVAKGPHEIGYWFFLPFCWFGKGARTVLDPTLFLKAWICLSYSMTSYSSTFSRLSSMRDCGCRYEKRWYFRIYNMILVWELAERSWTVLCSWDPMNQDWLYGALDWGSALRGKPCSS